MESEEYFPSPVRVGTHCALSLYLVEAGKWIVLPLFCHPSPVVEYGSITPGRVGEGHPLPGTDLLAAELGFHSPVPLSGVAGQQWRSISAHREPINILHIHIHQALLSKHIQGLHFNRMCARW